MLGSVRVRLAAGVEPERAIGVLNELAGNVSGAIRPTSQHPVDRRDDYVRWAMRTETTLESVLRREDAKLLFDNPRHRDIHLMPLGDHLTVVINFELEAKRRDLEAAARYVGDHRDRMRAARGLPIVVDSNVMLHCQRLDKVKWVDLLKQDARVMIPLRVIEEIDAKKYDRDEALRAAARRLVPWIERLFESGDRGPVSLRRDATIELLLAERPRYRPADADEEILDVAHDVLLFAGSVKVMTDDNGMRVRARSEGLDVLSVPPAWRRHTEE
jgi:rRNA-processing protein FCF1